MDRRETSDVTSASLATILGALLQHGPITRAEIGSHTGLSRPSVSRTISRLLKDGTVDEVADKGYAGRGRPPSSFRLSTRRADVLGVELGRRHVAIAVADITGSIVLDADRDIDPSSSLADRTEAALALFEAQTSAAGIDVANLRRVAVGTPGPHHRQPRSGQSSADLSLARLGWERSLVAEVVSQHLGVPFTVGNNTRYTALAEANRRQKAGLALENLVYLRVDEGVGGGIVANGKLQAGAWDVAGEMGHVSVDLHGAACFCGGRGCLELVAGLPAVMRMAGTVDLDELRSLASVDVAVKDAITAAATATAKVVSGVVAVVNPSVLVVGGSVATLPGFLEQLEALVRTAAPNWATLDLMFEAATTDHVLGAIGAAAAAHASLEHVLPLRNRKN